jgi:hypothetical protein
MTKDREPMPVHELCKFVSDRTDDYRVYDWRQVEGMRERVAGYASQLSYSEAKAYGLRSRMIKVHDVMEEMRGARLYEWADKLRDALEGRS